MYRHTHYYAGLLSKYLYMQYYNTVITAHCIVSLLSSVQVYAGLLSKYLYMYMQYYNTV